jgi:hypothetical protein
MFASFVCLFLFCFVLMLTRMKGFGGGAVSDIGLNVG